MLKIRLVQIFRRTKEVAAKWYTSSCNIIYIIFIITDIWTSNVMAIFNLDCLID